MKKLETADLPVILCVDDETSILKSLQRVFFSSNVQLLQASSGKQALEIMQQHKVNLIISDMRMPNMTGAEFLAQAAVMQPDSYRILMTGYSDIQSTVAAINIGKIHRYIQKPWDNTELLAQVNEGLETYRLLKKNKELTKKIAVQNKQLKQLNTNLEDTVQQRTQQLKQSLQQYKTLANNRGNEQKATLEVLYNLISINPEINGQFALKISETCNNIANLLGITPPGVEIITKAGLYSELGKLGLPSYCLNKPYDELTSADQKHFMRHPQLAEEILTPAVHLSVMSEIIASQYEQYNGTGEPLQTAGKNIHIGSRILSVARDFWHEFLPKKNIQEPTKEQVYKLIMLQQGILYDPKVVEALGKLIFSNENNKENIHYSEEEFSNGIHIGEISIGMRLSQNLYNRKHMLLLPKGHIFCTKTINNLQSYEKRHKETLLIKAEKVEK
jgi:response regulator RpfG family c-di-GMP phosphodiesterase